VAMEQQAIAMPLARVYVSVYVRPQRMSKCSLRATHECGWCIFAKAALLRMVRGDC